MMIAKLTLGLAGLLALAGQVHAGGPAPAVGEAVPMVAAEVPAVSGWQGFHLGAGLQRSDASVNSLTVNGLVGGGFGADGGGVALHAGYSHVFANRLMVGAELGYNTGDITGSGITSAGAPLATQTLKAMATLRLRLGVDLGRALPYVAFGVAQAESSRHTAYRDQTVGNDYSGSVLAAGVEWALSDRLALRAEYQHFDLGSKRYGFASGNQPTVELTGDTVFLGLSLRF